MAGYDAGPRPKSDGDGSVCANHLFSRPEIHGAGTPPLPEWSVRYWMDVTLTNALGTASGTNLVRVTLHLAPGFTGNKFQFTITGVPGFNYAIEASTNLVDWAPLSTNTSPFTFVDGDATNFPGRYYRSVYLP